MSSPLTIIIPAFNEEESLAELLPQALAFCKEKNFRLIVADDGSADKTPSVLQQFSGASEIKIIRHKVNKGYGAAIKSGVLAAETPYVVTVDADGQHTIEDVEKLFSAITASDADMVVGRRSVGGSAYRNAGRWLIRRVAKQLMPLHIHDLNSGMKIYNTALAKRYFHLCPDSMAYSDIIALVFISRRHLVKEVPITVRSRKSGKSAITTMTALETFRQILNIVVLFNPMRIFFPLSVFFMLVSLVWGLPIVLMGRGVSVGALLGFVIGIFFFFFGLIAEQLSMLRKNIKTQ